MKKKLLVSAVLCAVCYLLIPFFAVTFATTSGMGISFLLFFAADPLICACIGVIAGTDPKHLWWLPIVAALLMPSCFWLCVSEIIPELFVYSIGYLLSGLFCMGVTAFVKK